MSTLRELGKDELSVLNALDTAESMEDAEIAGAARLSLTQVHAVLDKLRDLELVSAARNNGTERFTLDRERVRQVVREVTVAADEVAAADAPAATSR
jgi:DNA-binding MarR family transcriptional regulator